ncbi:MAG: hypothetical protein JNM61_13715 [Zoogloeaceae bacterium]|nr:hypothetical protein [Zoogloeaceae bacterium]
MMRRWMVVFWLGGAAAIGGGCTSQQLYATGQSYQRNQCAHLPDQTEREKCQRDANLGYDDYKRETRPDTR